MMGVVAASVLVVDNDRSFRSLAARLLGRVGLQVTGEVDTRRACHGTRSRGQADFRLARRVVACGDGVALAAELCQLLRRPRVVLVSSDHDGASSAGLDQSGAAAFIPRDALTDAALRVARGLAQRP